MAFRYSSKPRPLHQSSLAHIDKQYKAVNTNYSRNGHVNWQVSGEMWRIAALTAAAAFLLYVNTIYADFAYDDRYVDMSDRRNSWCVDPVAGGLLIYICSELTDNLEIRFIWCLNENAAKTYNLSC